MESLRAKLKKVVSVDVWSGPEDTPYVGNCSAVDPETDAEAEQWIDDQLSSGNEWAWCVIRVRVSYMGRTATASLGGCSYASKDAFVMAGDYYDDMVNEAVDELMTGLRADVAILRSLGAKVTGVVL